MSSSEEEYDDVKTYFSPMEWSGLAKCEKERYRNMKRNHLAMLAIGLKATAPAFMRRGPTKRADLPTLPGLSDSEEEEWTPGLERPPPPPRSIRPPARRPAGSQGAAPPPSTPANPAAQPPSTEVAGPSGSRAPPQPHLHNTLSHTHTPAQEGQSGVESSTSQDEPSTSEPQVRMRKRRKRMGPEPSMAVISKSEVQSLVRKEVHRAVKLTETKMDSLLEKVQKLEYEPKNDFKICKLEAHIKKVKRRGDASMAHVRKLGLSATQTNNTQNQPSIVIKKEEEASPVTVKAENPQREIQAEPPMSPERTISTPSPAQSGHSSTATPPAPTGVTSESQTQVFSCSECPVSYTSQIYLNKHIKRNHDNLYVSLLRSGEIRPETLYSSSSRSLPVTTSNTPITPPPQRDTDRPRSYHCDQCRKNFTRESILREHQRVHTGEKPYHCDQCGKNFSQEGNLRRHQRVHTGEKPYHCDQCGKNFTRESILRKHQRIHTGEKPYHCDQCGNNFSQEGDLRIHQRVHTGEKPYHCNQCGKNFSDGSKLRRHQLVHQGSS